LEGVVVKRQARVEPIPCGEGLFWLAVVQDAFPRRIVRWKTSDRWDTDLTIVALEYGV
jgi:hypothetical protein